MTAYPVTSRSSAESLWNFQAGIVRWQARLLASLASLIEPYPPFSFDTGPSEPSTTTAHFPTQSPRH